jgi:hypothetical protein
MMPHEHRQSKWNVGRFINYMMAIILGLSIGCALLVPETILTDSTMLSAGVGLVASISPAINNLGGISSFPEVTRFVFALTYLATVPQFVVWLFILLTWPIPDEKLKKARERRFLLLVAFWIGAPALMFSFFGVLGHAPLQLQGGRTAERIIRLFSQDRFWLGVAAGMISFCIAFLAAAFIYSFRLLPKLFFRVTNARSE